MSRKAEALSPLALLILPVVALLAGEAHADAGAKVLVLRPHSDQAERDAALNRELMVALDARRGIELLPQPALDLEAAQLAIDCLGETPRCLREVAERAHATALIAPAVARKAGKVELSLLYFDAADEAAEPKRAVRTQAGSELEPKTLAAIPSMLHELLGEPANEEPEPAATEPAQETPAPAAEPNAPAMPGHALPLGAFVLGGAGLAVIGSGIVVGALMHGTQHDYAAQSIGNEMQARAAEDTRKRGEREALLANVLLGVGVATVIASGIWLVLGLNEHRTQTAFAPMLGPDRAGLVVAGSFGARD